MNQTFPSEKITFFALCMEKLGLKVDKVAELMGKIKQAAKDHWFTSA